MTSMTGTTQHPDVSEIADFGEGLLSVARATDIRRHLLSCALCEDVRSSLEEVESLLGSLPSPAPMPTDVAARIDAALAAEMRSVVGPSAIALGENLDVSRETSRGGSAGKRAEQAEQPWEPAAQVTGAECAAGDSAPRDSATHDSATHDSATHPKRKGPSAFRSTTRPSPAFAGPGRRSSGPRRRLVLGAVFGAGILGVGALLVQTAGTMLDNSSSSDSASSAKIAPPESRTPTASGAAGEFTKATLPEQVRTLLAGTPTVRRTEGADSPAQEAQPSATPLGDDPQAAPYVPACVQRALGRTVTPLGAEPGEYEGTETYLVVLPHPADSSLVSAYLVDARCTAEDPSGTGSLMFSHPYPRS